MKNTNTISSKEAAAQLNVTASRMRQYASDGKFEATKSATGGWLFNADLIQAERRRKLADNERPVVGSTGQTISSADADWTQIELSALRAELSEAKVAGLQLENERLQADNERLRHESEALRNAVQALIATADEATQLG